MVSGPFLFCTLKDWKQSRAHNLCRQGHSQQTKEEIELSSPVLFFPSFPTKDSPPLLWRERRSVVLYLTELPPPGRKHRQWRRWLSSPLTFPSFCFLNTLDLTVKLMTNLWYDYLPNVSRSAISQSSLIFIVMRIFSNY